MYCKCSIPKEKTSEALDKQFLICSKNIGGCGKEIIKRSHPKCSHCKGTRTMNLDSGKDICIYCNGVGFDSKKCEKPLDDLHLICNIDYTLGGD